jgi:ketosteroid isomerase-like protein
MMTDDQISNKATQAVLESQQQFWLALQDKDAELFMQVLAEDFVCRSPGEADQDRTTFITALTSIPLTILDVKGEAIAIRIVGDVAILSGTQIARMRLPNGETISERLALTNIFQHKNGRWEMIFAHPV